MEPPLLSWVSKLTSLYLQVAFTTKLPKKNYNAQFFLFIKLRSTPVINFTLNLVRKIIQYLTLKKYCIMHKFTVAKKIMILNNELF